MSVYTDLSFDDIAAILAQYNLGGLQRFSGIAAGIENSNFFVYTEDGRKYVLTIFERLGSEELPYFMRLMKHLATHGVQSPDVMVRQDGSLIFSLATPDGNKQGCIVSCLSGQTLDILNANQLTASGKALAKLHLAGSSFDQHRDNPTGIDWLSEHISSMQADVERVYGQQTLALLNDELIYQQQLAFGDLPQGVIHGDLFCDNILFEGEEVAGIIDFYYAHDAALVMDIAIAINAQAMLLANDDQVRMQAWLAGYASVRGLSKDEQQALPDFLRLAALRFWVSRLYDALYPRGGAMTQTKDPEEYRLKLLYHRS